MTPCPTNCLSNVALATLALLLASPLQAQSPGPGPGPDRGPGPPPGPTELSTSDWRTIAVADSPASPATSSAQHSDPLYYTPFPFTVTLQNSYTPTLSVASNFTPRGRFLISADSRFLSIGAQGTTEATTALVTYHDTLAKVVEAVPEGAGFRLDSELHARYSLDATADRHLAFKNTWGVVSPGDAPG